MSNSLSLSSLATPRVLILSLRKFECRAGRSFLLELEHCVGDFEQVDIIAPNIFNKITNRISLSTFITTGKTLSISPTFNQFSLNKSYDLFLFICQYPWELLYLNAIKDWRKKCRTAICWLDELWVKDVHKVKHQLTPLRNFDHVFMNLNSSIKKVSEIIHKPCSYLPPGIDAIKFCPYPLQPQRSIDISSIGRRPDSIHQSLQNLANQNNFFYMHNTVKGSFLRDYNEHRILFRNIVKRSRYFITYKPKFNLTSHTGDQEELSVRFFEGAAGGAVMLGMPPNCDAFSQNFDWSDAVIPLPENTTNLGEIIAHLDSQPERLNKIRTDNVVNSLLRHDWVYRWEKILDAVEVQPSAGMLQRKAKLQELAQIAIKNINFVN